VPLVLYVAFQKRTPWVAAHAADAFNFQFSFGVLMGASGVAAGSLGPVWLLAVLGVSIWGLVSAVAHSLAASKDVLYPYRGPVVRLLNTPPLLGAARATPDRPSAS
jgi:hypothetical protein